MTTTIRRLATTFALALALCAAAPPAMAAPRPELGATPPSLFDQVGAWLNGLWATLTGASEGDQGLMIDPNGAQGAGDEGLMIDPDGAEGEDGLMIDPNG